MDNSSEHGEGHANTNEMQKLLLKNKQTNKQRWSRIQSKLQIEIRDVEFDRA